MSLKRAIQNWNMKYVDLVRSPGSAFRVFTSSQRLANQLKINEIREGREQVTRIEMGAPRIGKLVKKNEMDVPEVEKLGAVGNLMKRIETGGPQARTLMKQVETFDREVGELVKKIQINDPKVERVGKWVRFGLEKKPEQDATLAGAGEEDEFINCFGDITGKELLWQAVKDAREEELKYLRELGVYEKVDERAAVAKYNVTPVDTKWVDTSNAFEVSRCKSVQYPLLRVTVRSSH